MITSDEVGPGNTEKMFQSVIHELASSAARPASVAPEGCKGPAPSLPSDIATVCPSEVGVCGSVELVKGYLERKRRLEVEDKAAQEASVPPGTGSQTSPGLATCTLPATKPWELEYQALSVDGAQRATCFVTSSATSQLALKSMRPLTASAPAALPRPLVNAPALSAAHSVQVPPHADSARSAAHPAQALAQEAPGRKTPAQQAAKPSAKPHLAFIMYGGFLAVCHTRMGNLGSEGSAMICAYQSMPWRIGRWR